MSGTRFCFVLLSILLLTLRTANSDSRDLIPLKSPSNLTLLEIKDRQVLIQWQSVEPQSVRGNFKGYLVRTWNHVGSQVYAFPPEVTKVNVEYFPFSKNFITVSVRNEKYVGPPSDAISFDAPQIVPNSPLVLSVYPLNENSVFVQWSRPTQPNGILLGYKIYCREVNDQVPEENLNQMNRQINDPDKLQAKLTGMEKGRKYRIEVAAINCAGESDTQPKDIVLEDHVPSEPSAAEVIYKIDYKTKNKDEECYKLTSSFIGGQDNQNQDSQETPDYDYYDYITVNESQRVKNRKHKSKSADSDLKGSTNKTNCLVDCLILWTPDIENENAGEYFYLQYRIKGEKEFNRTAPEMSEDFILLRNFDACKNYEMVLTTVDGDFKADSDLIVTPTRIFT